MAKLHELIAVEGDLKSKALAVLSEIGSLFSSGAGNFIGHTRSYTPMVDGGDNLPSENKEVGAAVRSELSRLASTVGGWIDVSVQKEQSNTQTRADVIVDGLPILSGLSAPALLNLESKLVTLRSVYNAIPTLDVSERWTYNSGAEVFESDPTRSYRTKKVPRALVLYDATDKHPAQVQAFTEDVPEGTWTTVKRSGAITLRAKRELLDRLDRLAQAVKEARQRANDVTANKDTVASAIFTYIHK